MSLLDKIDRFADGVAAAVSDPAHRRPVKVVVYVLLIAIVIGIPYSLIKHVYTSGFHVVSVEREKRVGLKIAEEMERKMTVLPGDDLTALYVTDIGRRIAGQNNPWGANFRFRVIQDQRTINAFALPGGKIYITTGLLNRLDNEAELASVLAHEVAHVSKRHYARNMGRQMLMSWVKKFLGGTDHTMLEAGSFLTTSISFLKMRQEDEFEADYQGTLYIYELDYDPAASATLQKKLLDMEKRLPDFVRVLALTHPPSRERLEAMITLKETLPEKEGLTLGSKRYTETIKPEGQIRSEQDWYQQQLF